MLKHGFISSDPGDAKSGNNQPRTILLLALFALGCVLGAYFGLNYSTASILGFDLSEFSSSDSSLFLHTFQIIRFHLLAILLGTSFLGMVFIPALSFVKGFALSCTSATIISSQPTNGIIMALIIIGVPSLFLIPSFIAISDDAFFRSGRIFSAVRKSYVPLAGKTHMQIFFAISALVIGVLIDMKLVPYLLSLLN